MLYRISVIYCLLIMIQPRAESQVADTARAHAIIQGIKWVIQIQGFDQANLQLDSAQATYKKQFGIESAQYANAMHFRGLNYYFNNRHEEALVWYDSSLHIRQRLKPRPELDIAKSYNNIGLSMGELGRYREALDYHEKAMAIRKQFDSVDVAYSWGNIGQMLTFFGDYSVAEGYCKLSLERLQNTKPPLDMGAIASVQNNLGGIFLYAGQPDSAEVWFQKAEASYKRLGMELKQPSILISIFQNRAIGKMKAGKYDEARALLDKAVEKCNAAKIDLKQPLKPMLIELYNAIAATYIEQKKPEESVEWSQTAIKKSAELFGNTSVNAVRSYINLASANAVLEQMDSARENLEKAFLLLDCGSLHPWKLTELLRNYFKNREKDIFDDSRFEQALRELGIEQAFGNLVNRGAFFDAQRIFIEYTMAEFFKSKNRERRFLEDADLVSRVTDRYLDYCRSTLSDSESRLLIQSYAFNFYERAVYAHSTLVKALPESEKQSSFRQACYYMEKCKALVLFESVRTSKVLEINGVDADLLLQEERLRSELARTELRYYSLKDGVSGLPDSIRIKQFEALEKSVAELGVLRKKLAAIKHDLNQSESYRKAHQADKPVALEQAQLRFCNDSTTVLDYLIGDTIFTVLVINRDKVDLVELPYPGNSDIVANLVVALRRCTEADTINTDSYQRWSHEGLADTAALLYDLLVKPVENQLKSNLIIIPDGPLCALPFEILLPNKPKQNEMITPGKWPFLINRHNIRYCYSLSLLNEMVQKPAGAKRKTQRFAGLAPWYPGNRTVLDGAICMNASTDQCGSVHRKFEASPLPWSGKEIYCIAQMFPGTSTTLYGSEASVERFRDLSGQCDILHLSLHGEANEKLGNKASLIFSKTESLQVSELFNMKIPADLVVLSACESGLGKFRRGEGLISMARGFALAGVKSMLQAMWYTDECPTASEMIRFYEFGLTGLSKSAALAETKKMMIRSGTRYAHPYYWAGFILLGDDASLR